MHQLVQYVWNKRTCVHLLLENYMILNLSLIPVLFTPCISYVLIPLYKQVHNVVSAQTC